jgi:uncharacterized membrane protein YeaQ/YmgE (transglycosylase-associated protein family)
MISLVSWVIFGAVAGGIAKAVMPGRVPPGWGPTVALGVLGSIAGGLPFGESNAGLIGSVIGACVVLVIYSTFQEGQS